MRGGVGVRIEENPGVMPILETMIFRSCLGTTSRTICSTWPTNWSVNSSRVPEGALRLMTNWPGIGAREVGLCRSAG